MAYPFCFCFCDKSPHLTFNTIFGSLLMSYPSRNLSDSVTGFVQLIEIHPRFLVRCIMGGCARPVDALSISRPLGARTDRFPARCNCSPMSAFGTKRTWRSRSTGTKQTSQLRSPDVRFRSGHRMKALQCPLLTAGSTGQCNTACSLSAGVSNPKVLRGR